MKQKSLFQELGSLYESGKYESLKKVVKDVVMREVKLDQDSVNLVTKMVAYDGELTATWLSVLQDGCNILLQ